MTTTPPQETDTAAMSYLARALHTSFILLVIALGLALAGFFLRSLFVVQQHEAGLVLRFGSLLAHEGGAALEPGSHFTFPYPIDERLRVPARRVQTVASDAFWYRASETANLSADQAATLAPILKPGLDGYALTGDGSIMHGRWALRYRIANPLRYCFAFPDQDGTFAPLDACLKVLLDSAVTQASANLDVDTVWRNRDDRFRLEVERRLRARLSTLDLGIEVERVDLTQASPPQQVRAAFDLIMQAESEQGRLLKEAEAYKAQTLSEASATAAELRSKASAYKTVHEQKALADTQYFSALLSESGSDRSILRQTLYQDTLRRVMAHVDEKFIVRDQPGRQLRLDLSRQPRQPGQDHAGEIKPKP